MQLVQASFVQNDEHRAGTFHVEHRRPRSSAAFRFGVFPVVSGCSMWSNAILLLLKYIILSCYTISNVDRRRASSIRGNQRLRIIRVCTHVPRRLRCTFRRCCMPAYNTDTAGMFTNGGEIDLSIPYMKRNKMYENLIAYRFRDKAECNRNYVFQFLARTQQIFEYTGLPGTIPAEYLELYLQYNGFACIAKHNENLYAFFGGLGGEPDVYYQPTICTVSNPGLNFDKTLIIDRDCVIIRNDLFYMGLLPIINRYATALVENDITMDMASKNMRSVAMISAPSDTVKKAADIFIQGVENGELSAVGDNAFLEGIKVFPMSGNASTRITDLIEYHQYLKAGLFNEIGLDANYNMKRERLSNGETELNQDSLVPLIQHMLKCRKDGVKRVNEMFGTNITVELSPLWQSVQEESETPNTETEPETETEVLENENAGNPDSE